MDGVAFGNLNPRDDVDVFREREVTLEVSVGELSYLYGGVEDGDVIFDVFFVADSSFACWWVGFIGVVFL